MPPANLDDLVEAFRNVQHERNEHQQSIDGGREKAGDFFTQLAAALGGAVDELNKRLQHEFLIQEHEGERCRVTIPLYKTELDVELVVGARQKASTLRWRVQSPSQRHPEWKEHTFHATPNRGAQILIGIVPIRDPREVAMECLRDLIKELTFDTRRLIDSEIKNGNTDPPR